MRGLKVIVYTLFFLIILLIADLVGVFYPLVATDVYISGMPYDGEGRIIYRYSMSDLWNTKLLYKTPELSVGLVTARVIRTTSISTVKDDNINFSGVVGGKEATKLLESAHRIGLKIAVGVYYYEGLDIHSVLLGDNIFQNCSSTVILNTSSFMSSPCFPKTYQFVDGDIKIPSNSQITLLAIKGPYNSIKKFLHENHLDLVTVSYLAGVFFYENMFLLLVFFSVLLVIVGITVVSMLNIGVRMEIIKSARKLFVFFSLGKSLRQLSIGVVAVEMLQIAVATIIALFVDKFLDKIRYFPTQRGIRFVLGLSGKEAYIYLSRSLPWRVILLGVVWISLLLMFWYWSRRNFKEVFYRRGVTTIPTGAIVSLSFLVTIIMVILTVWGITVYDRLNLVKVVYAPKGYIVQDNDLEVSLLQGYNTVKMVKQNSVSVARMLYIASQNTIYTCYTPDMEEFVRQRLPYINQLWADKKALIKNSCKPFKDSILTSDGVLDVTYIPLQQKDKFIEEYVDISYQRAQEMKKINPSIKVNIDRQLLKNNLNFMFYSAARRIRYSLNRAYVIASMFMFVSLFAFLYFMFSIAEIILKLTPFRLSIYIISGYTLRQALKEIIVGLLRWIVLASLSATVVGYIISKLLWVKLGWEFPSLWVFVLFAGLFVPLASYVGIEFGGLRLQKEGVIKVLKADV